MVTSDDNDDRQRVNDFFSILNQKLIIHRQTKLHLDRFLSTDFNVFTCIKPDEKRLSNIIANLLNPASSHGQQRVFLDAFLRRIKPNDLDGLLKQQRLSVTCERQTVYIKSSQRRIDILVEFENFALGIENKPWGGDQERQLNDYSNNLKTGYKDKFCLVYLTQDGSDPDEKSIECSPRERLKSERKLVCISYRRDILEWLRECCQLCESDKVRGFLFDFMNYIPTMEEQMSNSSESKIIIEHALENKDNLETALDVYLAYHELRRLISEDFHRDLQKCLEKHLDMSQWEFIPLKDDSLFGFAKKAWRQRYIVGTQLYSKEDIIHGVYFGVYKENPTPQKIEGLKEAIDLHTIRGKSDKSDSYWEWYCDLKPHWDPEKALVEMKYNRDAIKEKLCKHLADISKNSRAMELIDKYVIDYPTKY